MRKFTIAEARFVAQNQSKLSVLELAKYLDCTTKDIMNLYTYLLNTYSYKRHQEEVSNKCRENLHKEVTNEGEL